MGEALYKVATLIGTPWRYRIAGVENLADKNASSVFVSNHLGELGPIEMMLSFPLRLYPWVISEMMDPQAAPAYLFDDFIKPTLKMGGGAGMAVSTLLSKISIPLLNSLGGIPVYRKNGCLKQTFDLTLDALDEGKNILIFPEDPGSEPDKDTGIRSFMSGFSLLGQLYAQRHDGKPLDFYPVAIEKDSRTIVVGEREAYAPSAGRSESLHDLTSRLEAKVKAMYLQLKDNDGSDF